nr:hypothetical protein [Tanacetum cinerariifolium]
KCRHRYIVSLLMDTAYWMSGNEYSKKDKNEAKMDKTKYEMEEREKSKSSQHKTSTKSKVKDKAGTEEILNGPSHMFVRNPNKIPNSSQRPPHNYLKCGNPVDDLYCRQCALLRKKLKELWFTIYDENEIFQDFLNTSESSNDNTNVINAPQDPFVFNQDPGENSSQSPPYIDHHCYYGCSDSLDGIFYRRCTCESCRNGAHIGYNCPPNVLIISNLEPCYNQNVDEFPQTLPSFHPTCYFGDENSFTYDSNLNFLRETFQAWLQQHVVNLDSYTPEPLQYRKIPIYYDDDDNEESSTPLRDIIISKLPLCIAITPLLSTKEPKDSLIMGDEHLDTIPEKESNEFIKSSVENLVPNPSESEDLSNIRSEYDVPVCDDFMTFSNLLFDADDNFSSIDDKSIFDEDVPKEIYSNPLFDEEIISIKIDPHHFNVESDLIESLLNQDSSIISSSKIDSLFDEFARELIFLKSIPPVIYEVDYDPEEEIRLIEKLLYDNSCPCPPEEFNSENSDALIEPFSLSHILVEDSDSLMEEIDLSLTSDDSMPLGIENDDYDSEGDTLFLEELLSNDSLSLPKNESFNFDVPSSLVLLRNRQMMMKLSPIRKF